MAALWVSGGGSASGGGSSLSTMSSGMEKATSGMRDLIGALSTSETRYFDEERFSEAELKKALADGMTDKKIDAMKRILAHVSSGRDVSNLFADVVKNVAFHSLELKKLIYIYLVQYAENNRDLALMCINSFQKDLSDRSQLVRASALRALASIKVLEVIQLVMVAVKEKSVDSSPYVRKTAAQCMTRFMELTQISFSSCEHCS
jgi:AP-3 complex subunit beta